MCYRTVKTSGSSDSAVASPSSSTWQQELLHVKLLTLQKHIGTNHQGLPVLKFPSLSQSSSLSHDIAVVT